MNVGQILETHLGWVAGEGWYDDGSEAYKQAQKNGGKVYVSTPVFDGATIEQVDEALVKWQEEHGDERGINIGIDLNERDGPQVVRQDPALQRAHRRAVRGQGHRRLHVHPEAAPPRGRQDPRAEHGPLLARHPAAAGRQGAVRRPALRRDGGLGARGVRRGLHAAGDAHDQVRRHGRAREGLRGDRQGREHRRAVDPRVLQGAAEGDAVARARRERQVGGGRRRRDPRRGRRPAARRRGARHRPLRRPGASSPRPPTRPRRRSRPKERADRLETKPRPKGRRPK